RLLPRLHPALGLGIRLVSVTVLTPHTISPQRSVPASIERPEYVGKSRPTPYDGPAVRAPELIDRIRHASRIAARALDAVEERIAPGVTTEELDLVGHQFLIDHGAYPSTLGYRGYPKSLCSSV